jgi:HAD superfamily hydrolase (TIGR01509 family)
VIFDMDGVLVESELLTVEAACRMYAELGHAVTHADFKPFIGTGEDRFIGGVAEARGITLDLPRAKARMYAIYLEIIPGRLQAVAGAVDLVLRCKREGRKIAVASSADWIKVEANLAAIGLDSATFDAVVHGGLVARKKPAPDLFLETCRRLALDPADCLVIEDAVAGITAAHAAGNRCLAVTTSYPRSDLTAADWVVDHLTEIPDPVLHWDDDPAPGRPPS